MDAVSMGTGGTVNMAAGAAAAGQGKMQKAGQREQTVRAPAGASADSANRVQGGVTTDPVLSLYREQGVSLELSGEEPEEVESEKDLEKKQEDSLMQIYREQAEAAKDAAEKAGEGYKDLGRALEISRRMMHGDRVPQPDEQFLMEFDRDMYLSAKTMQALAQNDDPKKYDSVLEDEKEDGAGVAVKEDGTVVIQAPDAVQGDFGEIGRQTGLIQ